jgi:hypothetical protein
VDNDLIVGWDQVWAVPLDGGPSHTLGTGAVSVPGVEAGTVWLYDYKNFTRAWQVDLAGNTLHQVPLSGSYPVTGVAGGLLVARAASTVIVDAHTAATRPFGTGATDVGRADVGDVHGSKVVWNEPGTTRIHVTDVTTGSDRLLMQPPASGAVNVANVRFSPDGTQVAVPVGTTLFTVDVTDGKWRNLGAWPGGYPSVTWTPDGSQILAAVSSGTPTATELIRYDLHTGQREEVTLPVDGIGSTLAMRFSEASALLQAPLVAASSCPTPMIQPSGRTAPCRFAF